MIRKKINHYLLVVITGCSHSELMFCDVFEGNLVGVRLSAATGERFSIVGLFRNIRSMTRLLVVSASQQFEPIEWKI